MIKKIAYAMVAVATSILSACGGGGSANNVDPQGIWTGPASTGYTVNAVVLDTGEAWGFYTSGSTIYGALYGRATVNGSNVSIDGTDFNFLNNRALSGTYYGTVNANSSMFLSGNGVSVPLTYQSIYERPATAAAAMGTWSFMGRSLAYTMTPGTITVNSSGGFEVHQNGCNTTGSIVPRSGGKNVYNIILTPSGVGCVLGQSQLSGVTYIDTSVSPNRFFALALTSDKRDGLIVIGTKQ